MNSPLKNVADSVRARLLNIRTKTGEEYQTLLTRYCIERLLYRLSLSAHRDSFILKGAMLFTVWRGFPHRRTRDVDLLGFGDPTPQHVATVFREIISVAAESDDGVVFDESSVQAEEIKAQDEYVGSRVKLLAHIGAARVPMQIDVGYGDAVTPDPVEKVFPCLLDYPAPLLRCYQPETVIAEKLEAIATLGLTNSRLKDYFDLWFFSQHFDFDGARLSHTIHSSFQRRHTPLFSSTPEGLTADFATDEGRVSAWRAFWKKSIVGQDFITLEEMVRIISNFVLPPAFAAANETPFAQQWKAGGPWASSASG